jgi:hypothetical protein
VSTGTPTTISPSAPPVVTPGMVDSQQPNLLFNPGMINDQQQRTLNMDATGTISVQSGAATCPETYRGNGEFRTVTSKVHDAQGSMNTERPMDIDFKQEDQLAFARGGVQPRSRMVSSVKLYWNGLTGDPWDAFNQQLLGWGRQVGLGYLFNVMFRLE